MAQQTAVDWYVIEHRKLLIQLERKKLSLGEYVVKHQDILKQAKQMEREQIEKAHGTNIIRASKPNFKEMTGEEYYNQTYGK